MGVTFIVHRLEQTQNLVKRSKQAVVTPDKHSEFIVS